MTVLGCDEGLPGLLQDRTRSFCRLQSYVCMPASGQLSWKNALGCPYLDVCPVCFWACLISKLFFFFFATLKRKINHPKIEIRYQYIWKTKMEDLGGFCDKGFPSVEAQCPASSTVRDSQWPFADLLNISLYKYPSLCSLESNVFLTQSDFVPFLSP